MILEYLKPIRSLMTFMEYKTIILDRDGVINKLKKNYVKSIEEVDLINGSVDAINKLLLKGFNVVVASNQSCVGRGIISKDELNDITNLINSKFTKKIDFFYCLHEPDENCDCRKPKGGLINKIKSIYDGPYLFVGDNITDFAASENSKVDFALVKTGYGRKFSLQLNKKCIIYKNLFSLVESM